MFFFRLNSDISVISKEGGGIFNDPGRHKCQIQLRPFLQASDSREFDFYVQGVQVLHWGRVNIRRRKKREKRYHLRLVAVSTLPRVCVLYFRKFIEKFGKVCISIDTRIEILLSIIIIRGLSKRNYRLEECAPPGDVAAIHAVVPIHATHVPVNITQVMFFSPQKFHYTPLLFTRR